MSEIGPIWPTYEGFVKDIEPTGGSEGARTGQNKRYYEGKVSRKH